MTWRLAEGLVDEVVAYFEANIGAKVAALNAEYADATQLERPAATYVSEKDLLMSLPGYPSLFVLVDDSRLTRFDPGFGLVSHQLIIGMVLLHQDSDMLKRLQYRNGRLLWELLMEAFNSNAITYAPTDETPDIVFSPLFTNKADVTYLADVTVRCRYSKNEVKA